MTFYRLSDLSKKQSQSYTNNATVPVTLCDPPCFSLPSDQDWSSLPIRTPGQIQSAHEVGIQSLICICVCVYRNTSRKSLTSIIALMPLLYLISSSSLLCFICSSSFMFICPLYISFLPHLLFLSGLRKSWVTRPALLGTTFATPVPFECQRL